MLKAHGEEIRGAQNLVGLGLGVVVDGEVAALSGFGYADKANQVLVEADKTRFRWASISKSIVGVVAAKLASNGLLKLDDDALAVVDDFPAPKQWVKKCDGGSMSWAGQTVQCKDGWFWLPLSVDQQKVTFRQLLGNLGGIPHYSNGVKDPSPPQGKADDPKINTGAKWALSYLAGQPLVAVPGAAYKYTTFGFNLAGVAIGASQKTTLEALVKQWVSGPFQLKTLRPDRLWEDIPHRAVGYWKGDDGTVLLQGSSDVSWKLGGGGFISTVADMAGYCRALSDLDRFDEAARKLAWTSQKTSAGKETGYGLGFSIGGKNGKKRVGHSGSQQKVRSNLRLYPDEKLCFVMATNSTWASVSKVTNRLESLVRAALEVAEGP